MLEISESSPVLVTGANGYVAGWLVKRLLEQGKTVHAAVRDPSNKEKTKYLEALAESSSGTLRFFKSDLLQKGSYGEAMKGCELVFHTASPFVMSVGDPQKDLVEPAVAGTENVLSQATATESVKRVVLTSSCASIYGDCSDLADTPNGVFTEEVWNTSSSLEHQPYSYSKTMAERKAWEMVKSQNKWDLVVINPSFVLGPAINPKASSTSLSIMKQFGDGTMKMGAPRFGVGVVDVRDVAEAHLTAGFKAEAQGRYITHAHDSNFYEIGKCLSDKYGDKYPCPKKAMPKWLVWAVGPFFDKSMTRAMVSKNVDWPFKADNSKSEKELGVNYRPLEPTLHEMFQQLIDHDIF